MAIEPPDSISPSRLQVFLGCPLRFKVETIDKQRTPPGRAALLGTCVHRALELLFQLPPDERDREMLTAGLIDAIAETVDDEDYITLEHDEREHEKFFREAEKLAHKIWEMEDPTKIDVVATEQRIEVEIDGWIWRGIIDRLDRVEGGLAIRDFKSGRTPSEKYEAKSMIGMNFYSVMVEHTYGEVPVEVSLLHVKDAVTITAPMTARKNQVFRKKVSAIHDAIDRSCATETFPAKPSALCNFCAHKPACPAHA